MQDSIFLVQVLYDRSPRMIHYKSFPVKREIIGCSNTLEEAQNLISSYIQIPNRLDFLHSFSIMELPKAKVLSWHECLSEYVYASDGRLLDALTISNSIDDDAVYEGRDPETLRFKPGDIVEVYNEYSDEIKLGVVTGLPPTKEWTSAHNSATFHLDASDDSYWVIYPDDPYACWDCSPLNLFSPAFPVHPNVVRTLEKAYQAYKAEPVKNEIMNTTARTMIEESIKTIGWDSSVASTVITRFKNKIQIEFLGKNMHTSICRGPVSQISVHSDLIMSNMPRVMASLERIAGLKHYVRSYPIKQRILIDNTIELNIIKNPKLNTHC